MRFETIIFDLDDTIYPEWEYTRSGFEAVETSLISSGLVQPCSRKLALEWYKIRKSGERRVFDRWLESGDAGAVRCLEHWGTEIDAKGALVELFRSHLPTIRPFAGIDDLIRRLRIEGCRIGLVSDGELRVQQSKFRSLGLAALFDAVVFSDEFGRDCWKPDPAPFIEVLKRLEVGAQTAVYIADNPLKDFLGARRCHIHTIRLQMAGGVYADVDPPTPEHKADVTVRSLPTLTELLNEVT